MTFNYKSVQGTKVKLVEVTFNLNDLDRQPRKKGEQIETRGAQPSEKKEKITDVY